MEQCHLIKKQIIEITTGNKRHASDLQERISNTYHQKIIPYIDECCTALSQPETIHKIEKLEINIGTINANYLETEFEEKLKPLIYKQLRERIGAIRPTFSIQQPETAEKSNTPAQHTGTDLEMLTCFVHTGLLPWWAKKQDKASLEKKLEALIISAPGSVKSLFSASVKNTTHFSRLLFHFSDALLLKIAMLIAPQLASFIKNYWIDLQQLTKAGIFKNLPKRKIRFEQWRGLLLSISLNKFTAAQQEILVEQHLLHLAVNLKTAYADIIPDIAKQIAPRQKKKLPFKSSLPQIITDIKKTLKTTGKQQVKQQTEIHDPQIARQLKQLQAQLHALRQQERTAVVQEQLKAVQQKIAKLQQKTLEVDNQRAAEVMEQQLVDPLHNTFNQSDEIYITNAGLILLWPFITRFFQTLGLVNGKIFVDEIDAEAANNNQETKRERAALLLQHLADGTVEMSEHLLPLNKILCGIDLDQPLDTELILSTQEKEESENLLVAVITNNPMWKNLSPEGLQSAYLQREGVLSSRDGGWWLQVETKTHDITLDKLPWGTSVVKLPWMEHILYTEW